jgi:hypothetical protein
MVQTCQHSDASSTGRAGCRHHMPTSIRRAASEYYVMILKSGSQQGWGIVRVVLVTCTCVKYRGCVVLERSCVESWHPESGMTTSKCSRSFKQDDALGAGDED